ncbi:MAG: CPBP family intramembrane metalloprotease [Spirochaetales bacterium]|nr:CPBP family intramembrane metalloprotease [Spirochaetales bacterium]
MNKTVIYKSIELVILFVFIPLMLLLNPFPWINLILILSACIYCVYILLKKESNKFSSFFKIGNSGYLKTILLRFIAAAVISTIIMYLFNRKALFSIVMERPFLWLMISVFYSFFSVLPQEILFRTYFFTRYESFFPSNKIYIILFNAALFSIAHIFFRNIYVLLLTFIGGILFALSYIKTRSLLLVSIEHAIYGFWLFTLGVGEMLAFPV